MLSFKLEQTKDLITAHAGLAQLDGFTIGLGVLEALDKNLIFRLAINTRFQEVRNGEVICYGFSSFSSLSRLSTSPTAMTVSPG